MIETAGCEFCSQEFNRPKGDFECPYCHRKTNAAASAYAQAYQQAIDLVAHVECLLVELPDPDNASGDPPDWGHVGSVCEVNKRLAAIVAFLDGTEV